MKRIRPECMRKENIKIYHFSRHRRWMENNIYFSALERNVNFKIIVLSAFLVNGKMMLIKTSVHSVRNIHIKRTSTGASPSNRHSSHGTEQSAAGPSAQLRADRSILLYSLLQIRSNPYAKTSTSEICRSSALRFVSPSPFFLRRARRTDTPK